MVAASRLPLSRTVIADAALELVEEHGFENLTMRRLGESLDVDAMSLYHYFESKDALLDSMVDRLFERVASPGMSDMDAADGDPHELFGQWLRAIRGMYDHPAALELFSTRIGSSSAGPLSVLWSGSKLLELGMCPEEAAVAYRLICSFITGFESSSRYVGGLAQGAQAANESEDSALHEFLSCLESADRDAVFDAGVNMLSTAVFDDRNL